MTQVLSQEESLNIAALRGVAAELFSLREYPPLTRRKDGKYEGNILGFVRGLRFSARIIYFLRSFLESDGIEVNWGHIVKSDGQSFTPECDIILHSGGVRANWNGFENPVMSFKFIALESVKAVVSCKSMLTAIDADYPKTLKKAGVNNVLLLAECCSTTNAKRLEARARRVGYGGLLYLYTMTSGKIKSQQYSEKKMLEFFRSVKKLCS